MQRFIIFDDYGERYREFVTAVRPWLEQNKTYYREDVTDGLENAPRAFIGMLEGSNSGKLVVRVGPGDMG